MSGLRTPEEVVQALNERAEQGKGDEPYVLSYAQGSQLLMFFGVVHGVDPDDDARQAAFDKAWSVFAARSNRKVLIHENQVMALSSKSVKQAVKDYGAVGQAIWRAREIGVECISGEPGRQQEVTQLMQRFGESDILVYLFARQMRQWQRQDYRQEKNWRKYAERMVNTYAPLQVWTIEITLANILEWYKQAAGKEFDPKDESTPHIISDPHQDPIAAEADNYRNEMLLARIAWLWKTGKDIFVFYGSSHAVALEPALKQMVQGDDGAR